MRWCTTSSAEQNKCNAFKDELRKLANDSTPGCVQANNTIECMEKIQKGEADLITLDGGEIYTAGNTEKIIRKITLEVPYFFYYIRLD